MAGAPTRARIAAFSAAAALLVWTPALVLAWREWGALASRLRFGADYISFYAASVLTLEGAPARVYDLAAHNAIQTGLFPESGYSWFLYPPVYLLVCWPLALAPYFVSLGAWLAVTFAAWFAMARRLAPAFVGVAPFVVFPAVMMNATHGQNAFLTCALMGAGVMCLQRRPLVAGLLFGALAFKPQIGILIPVLLIAGGHWRAFFAAAATVAGLCLASVAAFGVETWSAYLDALPQGRRVMEDGLFGLEKLQSVFAMVRIAGASVETAYAAQAAVALTVAALLAYVTARSRDALACGALLCAGAALATPFILRYDFMLLSVALLWLAHDASRSACGARRVRPAARAARGHGRHGRADRSIRHGGAVRHEELGAANEKGERERSPKLHQAAAPIIR